MGKKQDRYNLILKYLLNNQAASVKELSEILEVTEMTIRRDLAILSQEKKIKFIQGVAINNNSFLDDDYSIDREEQLNVSEKKRIGEKAAEIVESGDIIFLDSGTTVGYILQALPRDLRFTIITNCLRHVTIVQNNTDWELVVPGGVLHRPSMTLVNSTDKIFPANIRISKAFLSTTGISRKLGVTCPYLYESELKKIAIQQSDKSYLVADNSKFDKISIINFADINAFDTLITDEKIPLDYKEYFQKINMDILIV